MTPSFKRVAFVSFFVIAVGFFLSGSGCRAKAPLIMGGTCGTIYDGYHDLLDKAASGEALTDAEREQMREYRRRWNSEMADDEKTCGGKYGTIWEKPPAPAGVIRSAGDKPALEKRKP